MTLAIECFRTRCRAGPGAAIDRRAIETLVREELPRSCAALLGEAFAQQRGFVRLRQIRLSLRVARRDWDKRQLAQQWSAALAQALRQALAQPGSADIVRYEEADEWLAAVIEALLTASIRGNWRFKEYEHLADLQLDQALQLLIADDALLEPILVAVARRGAAPALLRAVSDGTLERWAACLDAKSVDVAATSEQILAVLENLLRFDRSSAFASIQSARLALTMWLRSWAQGQATAWAVQRSGLTFIAVAIRALQESRSTEHLARYVSELRAIEHANLLRQVLASDDTRLPRPTHAISALREQLSELASVLQPASRAAAETVYSSDIAGLLLLVGAIARSNWPRLVRHSALWQRLQERTLTYLLADVGLRVAQHAGLACSGDPAIAVLAGWLDEPDWRALERFRSTVTAEECADLARAIDVAPDVRDWPQLVDRCSGHLLRQFAGTVRGFRSASEGFIARKLLAVRGELRIDEQRIAVVLATSPYHVALHVCSGFAKLEAVSWLGWRDVVFHPGGE
jgi:hypothetical protein